MTDNLRYCIIGDVHNKHERVERIIKAESPDFTVIAGDEFDDLYDNPSIARKTALWLKDSLRKKDRVHLVGNHLCSYMFSQNRFAKCSGYTLEKDIAINDVLTNEDYAKFRWYYFVNGWLLTHAGLHPEYYKLKKDRSLEDFLEQESKEATKLGNRRDGRHWFFTAGNARGGAAKYGGITWLDYIEEFEPIEGVKQIVGHSRVVSPSFRGDNVCIDTDLRYYLIIKGNTLEVKEYADL